MSETEKLVVGGLVTLLLLFTPGLLHEVPLFPGSLAGTLLGIAGALLMVLLLIYPLVKHTAWLRQRVTKHVSMRAILSFHVYAGVLGAALGVLHTGYEFQSPLGILLVSSMLIVVPTRVMRRASCPCRLLRCAASLRSVFACCRLVVWYRLLSFQRRPPFLTRPCSS